MIEVTVRVYGPLNDFLPAHRRQVTWTHGVDGHPSVKDVIESLGVPHPEIDLILVNRISVPFDLQPFSRCLRCNGLLRAVPKSAVEAALLPRTRRHYDRFEACSGCGRTYWKGSHIKRLTQLIDAAREEADRPTPGRHGVS